MSIKHNGITYQSGNNGGASSNLTVRRDISPFASPQTIQAWAATCTTTTEKTILSGSYIPRDVPSSRNGGTITPLAENAIVTVHVPVSTTIDRMIVYKSLDTGNIYSVVYIMPEEGAPLNPQVLNWIHIGYNATELNGYDANHIYNKTEDLTTYIGDTSTVVDIREKILTANVPAGLYKINTDGAAYSNYTNMPMSGILLLSVASSVINNIYHASIIITKCSSTPTSYVSNIYGESYSSWIDITQTGGSSGGGVAENALTLDNMSESVEVIGTQGRLLIEPLTDLNELTTNGAYYSNSQSYDANLNYPVLQSGYLNVYYSTQSSIMQEYITPSSCRKYTRYYNGTTWTSWRCGAQLSDIASASATGMVTSGSQTFGGNKTFNGNVTINGTFSANNTIYKGTSAPTDTTRLWIDTANNGVLKYYDDESSSWKGCTMVWA